MKITHISTVSEMESRLFLPALGQTLAELNEALEPLNHEVDLWIGYETDINNSKVFATWKIKAIDESESKK